MPTSTTTTLPARARVANPKLHAAGHPAGTSQPEATAGPTDDGRFYTNPKLNRATRWRRQLLRHAMEIPNDLIVWLIAAQECGDWDSGKIAKCSHERLAEFLGMSTRTSKRRLSAVRDHPVAREFLSRTHRGSSNRGDSSSFLLIIPGEEAPGDVAAKNAGESSGADTAGDTTLSPEQGTPCCHQLGAAGDSMVSPLESSDLNQDHDLFKKGVLEDKRQEEAAGPPEKKRIVRQQGKAAGNTSGRNSTVPETVSAGDTPAASASQPSAPKKYRNDYWVCLTGHGRQPPGQFWRADGKHKPGACRHERRVTLKPLYAGYLWRKGKTGGRMMTLAEQQAFMHAYVTKDDDMDAWWEYLADISEWELNCPDWHKTNMEARQAKRRQTRKQVPDATEDPRPGRGRVSL